MSASTDPQRSERGQRTSTESDQIRWFDRHSLDAILRPFGSPVLNDPPISGLLISVEQSQ